MVAFIKKGVRQNQSDTVVKSNKIKKDEKGVSSIRPRKRSCASTKPFHAFEGPVVKEQPWKPTGGTIYLYQWDEKDLDGKYNYNVSFVCVD